MVDSSVFLTLATQLQPTLSCILFSSHHLLHLFYGGGGSLSFLSRYSKKGTPFYVNKLTGANTWEKPHILARHSHLEEVSQTME